MFRLFKKRQQPSAVSAIWMRTGQWIEVRIRRLADKLNRRAETWSRRSIIIGLIIFCSLFSSLFIYNLTQSTHTGPRIDPIIIPAHTPLPADNAVREDGPFLGKEALRRLVRFKQFLDSLQQSPTGVQEYDRITKEHPGIRDSIEYIISLYMGKDKNVEYGKEK
ncbi:hypothetical protein [Paraflavitalea pollutisoli]|uniref:hypothetical protein n=1 Tax=Paraflavitalea pollutisoli TaxID=3034143 RepID=UPI0023ED84ED|nr:hypothetical protein [Paraflavitalea sp. H1-2-19X]